MNALLVRKYRPEEFHNLSSEEAKEMQALSMSRVDYDRFRLARAHGDLSCGILHLARAKDFFKEHTPELAVQLSGLIGKLGKLVPSYTEFSSAASKKKGFR